MSAPSRPFREEDLRDIAGAFPYPPTPDIPGLVGRRLADGAAPRAWPRPLASIGRRRAWIALAVLLAMLAATVVAVPEARAIFQRFFRLGAIEIVRVTPTPGPAPLPPSPTATAIPGTPTRPPATATPPPPWNPRLVGETTLANARQRVGFPILLPAYPPDLGPPARVWVQSRLDSALVLAWLAPDHSDQPRLLLYEMTNDVFGEKTVSDTTIIQETQVARRRALWVNGPHIWEFYDPQGQKFLEPVRFTAGNVLIWQDATGITYRLESLLSLTEATRVAESLR